VDPDPQDCSKFWAKKDLFTFIISFFIEKTYKKVPLFFFFSSKFQLVGFFSSFLWTKEDAMAWFDRWKAGYSLVDEEDVITDLGQIFDKYQL
jgi:hypothetical protein